MDIKNNKTCLPSNIKRFTLTATASAILALNAERVIADPCPFYINDTLLAGQVCEFNGVPPSTNTVTLGSSGKVGSILMQGYNPLNSFIEVDTGGIVDDATASGIKIQNSSLTNGIINNGTISSTSAVGIDISAASLINGGISNSGLISGGSYGIDIAGNSTINGGMFNSASGTISSAITAIVVNSSNIIGDISNSGTISTDGNGFVAITISNTSSLQGNIINSGIIRANNGNGIVINAPTGNTQVTGDMSNNSGVIHGGQSGIQIGANTIFQGNISNSGTISGGTAGGLNISNATSVGKSIINSGTISGGSIGLRIHSVPTVSGSISNSGKIIGGVSGIQVSSTSSISGSLSNAGTISGGQTGIRVVSNSAINGGISNSGTIRGNSIAINIINSTVPNIDIQGKTARIVGTVSAVNTNMNITNGAVFTNEGRYSVRTFSIIQNALLNMANTITVANDFINSGTLVTNSSQTIAVTGLGSYIQNSGALFQTDVASATNYGQLFVNGTADLSQSGDIYVQIGQNNSLHAGDVLSNVISGNTFYTPTNGFNVTDNSFIWKFIATLNNTNKGVNLTATINPAAYHVCQGMYCQGAANTII